MLSVQSQKEEEEEKAITRPNLKEQGEQGKTMQRRFVLMRRQLLNLQDRRSTVVCGKAVI